MKTMRNITLGFILGTCIVIVSILVIGAFYAQPNVEDLELAILARDLGLWKAFVHLAITYDGRYSTNFLQGFNPLVLDRVQDYHLVILFSITLFGVGLFSVAKCILHNISKLQIMGLSILFGSCFFMACPSLVYCLYWMGSSFVYLYPCIFLLFSFSSILWYLRSEMHKKTFPFFVATLTLFIGIGFSELFLPFYLFFAIATPVYLKKFYPQLFKAFIPIGLVIICCVSFVLLTPGLIPRFEGKSFDSQISFGVLSNAIVNYLTATRDSLFTLPALFLTISAFWIYTTFPIESIFRLRKIDIVLLCIGFIVLPFAMTLPFYFTKSFVSGFPTRVYIPVRFIHFLLLFWAIIPAVSKSLKTIMQRLRVSNFLLIATIFIGILNIVSISKGEGSIGLLVKEYRTGELSHFNQFMSQRYELLAQKGKEEKKYSFVCVEELTNYPLSLYTHPDLESNRNQSKWNKYIEAYFRIDEVKTPNDTSLRFAIRKENI
mgnify:CR=1 FL=1